MGKRQKIKRVRSKPDDSINAGPLQFARFGNLIVGKSHATTEEHQIMLSQMADSLPRVVAEIDNLVAKIATLVASLPPDRLLHRAWWQLAATLCGIDDSRENPDSAMAIRMVDYVQSVITSTTPEDNPPRGVSEESWKTLSTDIHILFNKITLQYQTCRTAYFKRKDANYDMALDEFRFRAETVWMNVRGKRYQPHEKPALVDVLTPHSDILVRLFGVDAPTIAAELDIIITRLTHGINDCFQELDSFRIDVEKRIHDISNETGITDLKILHDKLFQEQSFNARRKDLAGTITGIDMFDLEKITKLPKLLLNELAWSPGEEKDFFAPGEHCGWPLRVWPIMKRPFIRLNDRIYCFDLHSLCDNIYRVLQRTIFRLAPEYKQTWNDRQKTISEELPFKYFQQLLPGAQLYRPAYYRWKTSKGSLDWHEADGLIIYDDHLFIIEVKAGAFTYTSPATDLDAHISSLKSLVLSPAVQGNRFADYLESAEEVSIADIAHKEIGRLKRTNVRHVTVCAITLDPFTELASRAQHLKKIGINVGQRPIWALSIDDLRVYADMFINPLIFLHFVEQRMRAYHSEYVDLNDEMDHLGLYFSVNNYSRFATELFYQNNSTPSLIGYSKVIDDHYTSIIHNDAPKIPKQKIPERIIEIIDYLSVSQMCGRTRLSSLLLDADEHLREQIANYINSQLNDSLTQKRHRAFSTRGELALTFWVWPPFSSPQRSIAEEHARAVSAAQGESIRTLIELEYSSDMKLIDIKYQDIILANLSKQNLYCAQLAGAELRKRRLQSIISQRKIGANEPCPCGSGRKYKRCCRN